MLNNELGILKIKSSIISGEIKKWIIIIYLYRIIIIHLITILKSTKQTLKSSIDMCKMLKSSKFTA